MSKEKNNIFEPNSKPLKKKKNFQKNLNKLLDFKMEEEHSQIDKVKNKMLMSYLSSLSMEQDQNEVNKKSNFLLGSNKNFSNLNFNSFQSNLMNQNSLIKDTSQQNIFDSIHFKKLAQDSNIFNSNMIATSPFKTTNLLQQSSKFNFENENLLTKQDEQNLIQPITSIDKNKYLMNRLDPLNNDKGGMMKFSNFNFLKENDIDFPKNSSHKPEININSVTNNYMINIKEKPNVEYGMQSEKKSTYLSENQQNNSFQKIFNINNSIGFDSPFQKNLFGDKETSKFSLISNSNLKKRNYSDFTNQLQVVKLGNNLENNKIIESLQRYSNSSNVNGKKPKSTFSNLNDKFTLELELVNGNNDDSDLDISQILHSAINEFSNILNQQNLKLNKSSIKITSQNKNLSMHSMIKTEMSSKIFDETFYNKYLVNEESFLNVVHNTFLIKLKQASTKNVFINFMNILEDLKKWMFEEFEKKQIYSNAEQFMKYFNLQVPIKQDYYSCLSSQDKIKLMCFFFCKFFNRTQLLALYGDFWPHIKLYFDYKTHSKL